ncbi:MAG: hypothetical protein K6D97_07870 [Clostridia bacterium]|nr:hypothetical protein [Clostridia bacterium]
MSVLHINKPYRIISRREFFSNPSFYEKYRSLLEYKPYKPPEFDKDKFKKTGETVSLTDRWIKTLYEERVNGIVSEIKRAVPNNKNEQLKAVFNYTVRRCKYWDDYPRGTDRFKRCIGTW